MNDSVDDKQEIQRLKLQISKYTQSERELKKFIAHAPVGLYRVNKSGDLLMGNHALVKMLKYDSWDELKNTNILKVKKTTKTELRDIKQELDEKDKLICKETIWLAKDNSEIFVREKTKVILKENGEIDYYEGVVEDVTESKQAEDKLNNSEEQFRMIAENTNDLITISTLSLKAVYTYVSPSIKQVSGFDANDLIGKSVFDFMHPNDKKRMIPFLKNLIKKNISNLFSSQPKLIEDIVEYRALHKSGEWRDMQSKGSIIGGKMLFVSRDVTEHKVMLEKLTKSEEQFRMITENTKDTIALHKFNSKMTYLYLSPGFQELTGYSPEEYIGKSPLDLLHPDDKVKLFPILKEYLGYKINKLLTQEKRKAAVTIEYRMRVKSGEWRYYQAINRVVGKNILSVSRDITEQREAQENIKTSEHRLKKAKGIAGIEFFEYDLIDEKIFVTDRVKTLYNLKIKQNIIDPAPIYKLAHPDDLALINNTVETARVGKTPNSIDCRIVRPNKEIKWFHANFELSFNNKQPKCLFVTLLDITESKKAEEDIEHARERLSVANSILRHDITNDLIVIKSAVRLYKRNSDLDMLDEIDKRVTKSLNLIKLHRNQENLIDSSNDLKKVELVPILNKITGNYGEIELNVTGNETVYADSAITSVFENLLSNSIKHGNATKVDILISSNKKVCQIKVSDNGTGIAEDIKDKIFDKGFIHGKNGHTGIGLYIVKQTITSYGGEIYVQDNEPNGTVFIIILRREI